MPNNSNTNLGINLGFLELSIMAQYSAFVLKYD